MICILRNVVTGIMEMAQRMNTGSEEIKIHHENVNGEMSLSPTYIMNVAQLIIILNAKLATLRQ